MTATLEAMTTSSTTAKEATSLAKYETATTTPGYIKNASDFKRDQFVGDNVDKEFNVVPSAAAPARAAMIHTALLLAVLQVAAAI
jgi:hypothetical protein